MSESTATAPDADGQPSDEPAPPASPAPPQLRRKAGGRHRAPAAAPNRMRWYVASVLVAALAGLTAGALYLSQAREATPVAGPSRVPSTSPAQGTGGRQSVSPTASAGQGAGSATRPECHYEPVPVGDGRTAPVPPSRAELAGPVRVSMNTNQGVIVLELDATDAPCTVNSFVNLARSGFYADTSCHRLTTATIFVLQCGDPTGTGTGSAGYRFADENLPTGVPAPYARGTVAMANSGPHTNGSQFFLVYDDSPIDPNYPVFGRVVEGIGVLEKIAAGGAANNDGMPNTKVVVTAVSMG
jgi:peptidyl-prolyl cis-trans isomerase B (cyclophilin B)